MFHDLRDYVILSVGENDLWVVLLIVGIISVILVTGILFAWHRLRHDNQNRHSDHINQENHHSDETEAKVDEDKVQKSHFTEKENVKRSNSGSESTAVSNGHVRHGGAESPVKSRIPVRARVKQT